LAPSSRTTSSVSGRGTTGSFGERSASNDSTTSSSSACISCRSSPSWKDIRPLPKGAVDFVSKLNDLRNAVAHAFFPENLRGKRTLYDGIDVFSIEGFGRFAEDREDAIKVLFRRAFGV
jgi:hypothetical protein